tara:strand:- start:681 stop:1676 length:996 start_codon:yes stop_codon:yes gene_type:complete
MKEIKNSIKDFVSNRNSDKILFTAGPSSLSEANIYGLRPCFGRGDLDYENLEKRVLERLRKLSGHSQIVRMQGSASLALEIMIINFLYGKLLLIDTGFYSKRLYSIINSTLIKKNHNFNELQVVNWKNIDSVKGEFDWVVCCYTETSCGLKLPIKLLRETSEKLSAKLMLDATASIGLEDNHQFADVIAYSSCKGLFGLTGAAFIAYNETPVNEVDSFYLNIRNHSEKRMTGPYHSICSMDLILDNYSFYKAAVLNNKKKFIKKYKKYLSYPEDYQPQLCTYVTCKIKALDDRAIIYHPRSNLEGSVVCHLGEVHLGENAKGNILNYIGEN